MTDPVTVLVVDDQDSICNLVSEILQRSGYSVLTATSGEKALILFSEHGNHIRTLMTDCDMPGMSGCQLAERLISLRPELAVIFMSGSGPGLPGYPLLAKPFLPTQVVECVRDVIGEANHKPPHGVQPGTSARDRHTVPCVSHQQAQS